MNLDDLISVAEAAQQKGVSTRAIYGAIKAGTIPIAAERFGKILLARADVEAWTPRNYRDRKAEK